MLSCGALERSYNPHIASIVEPFVSKNQKGNFALWVWLERKSWKRAETKESEKEKNSFEIHVTILKYVRNLNLPFKKDFKFPEILTKTSFFLYVRDRPKNSEWNKPRRHQKYMRKSN